MCGTLVSNLDCRALALIMDDKGSTATHRAGYQVVEGSPGGYTLSEREKLPLRVWSTSGELYEAAIFAPLENKGWVPPESVPHVSEIHPNRHTLEKKGSCSECGAKNSIVSNVREYWHD